MADFATEINELMTAPTAGQGAPKGARSFSDEISELMVAPPAQSGGPFEANLVGLGRWVQNNPGQAAEILAQFVGSGVGMAAGAAGGPPAMATGAAAGNLLGRQAARLGRRALGATAEEAPLLDPIEMSVDALTGAAGQAVRPLARTLTGSQGIQNLPVGAVAKTPDDMLRSIAGASASGVAERTAAGIRRLGEIGGLGSAIGGQPVLGAAVYLGSHAVEPLYRRTAEGLLNNRGFLQWVSQNPGMNWREAVTSLGAMSADTYARYGMGADVRDAIRILADTVGETVMPSAQAQAPDNTLGARPNLFASIVDTEWGRRDRMTGRFIKAD